MPPADAVAPVVPTAPDTVDDVELVEALPSSSSICAESRAITALSAFADAAPGAAVGVGSVLVDEGGVWATDDVCGELLTPLGIAALDASSPVRLWLMAVVWNCVR